MLARPASCEGVKRASSDVGIEWLSADLRLKQVAVDPNTLACLLPRQKGSHDSTVRI